MLDLLRSLLLGAWDALLWWRAKTSGRAREPGCSSVVGGVLVGADANPCAVRGAEESLGGDAGGLGNSIAVKPPGQPTSYVRRPLVTTSFVTAADLDEWRAACGEVNTAMLRESARWGSA